MWGLAFGLAAFALAAFELFTRERAAPAQLPARAAVASRSRVAAAQASCGLQPQDIELTQRWLRMRIPAGVDIRTGMQLMPNFLPPDVWPDFAVRVRCYLARTEG